MPRDIAFSTIQKRLEVGQWLEPCQTGWQTQHTLSAPDVDQSSKGVPAEIGKQTEGTKNVGSMVALY